MNSQRKTVEIYTDGGADPNPGCAGWAAILVLPETGYEKPLSGGVVHGTNNEMELTAAIKGLQALKFPCDVTLYSDSQYLVKGASEWMNNWRRERAGIAGRKNGELWLEIERQCQIHNITWVHVRGHSGHAYNEECDRMVEGEIRNLQNRMSNLEF